MSSKGRIRVTLGLFESTKLIVLLIIYKEEPSLYVTPKVVLSHSPSPIEGIAVLPYTSIHMLSTVSTIVVAQSPPSMFPSQSKSNFRLFVLVL